MYDNYTWVPIFKKITNKVYEFRNNRKKLLNIMYSILEEIGQFDDNDETNCNLDKFNGKRCRYDDFDPFSFMNRLAIYSEENRKEFIRLFEEKTGMEIEIPSDFNGVPSVNPQKSCFLSFKDDRKDGDVDDLWKLFVAALKLVDNDSYINAFVKYYDKCLAKPNCRFNLSMALFRMNADYYPSLDETNRALLKERYNINIKDVPSGGEYINLMNEIKNKIKEDKEINSLPEFSYKAWLRVGNKEENNNKNYVWLFAPGVSASLWNECLKNGEIYIGWDKIGDMSKYHSEEEVYDALVNNYPENPNPIMNKCACYDFVNKMNIGDTIIIKKGTKLLLGYGEVVSDYIYDDAREEYKSKRKVKWIKTGEWLNNSGTKNPTKTLTEISQYKGYSEELLSIMGGDNVNYYFVNANPAKFSFSDIGVGETIEYTSINEQGHKRKVYKNYEDIKVGDKVIAYESTPVLSIVGLCEVVGKDKDNNVTFRKDEVLDNPIAYANLKSYDELKHSEFITNHYGSLFRLTIDQYDLLMDIIRESNPEKKDSVDDYTEDNFKKDVYIDFDTTYKDIINLLRRKKCIILQGAPGVGKTFMAKRIAYSLMKKKYENRIEFVQFHQSYSYEDFVEGYRPQSDGSFDIKPGIFYRFCNKARNNPKLDYYFIIDEINRGNISKIFGELLMLIEEDKRDMSISLAYDDNKFSIPENLYIIGMMNTADRSLAIMDYALRRRFSFIDIEPGFESKGFKDYQKKLNNKSFDEAIEKIIKLNEDIEKDPSLGAGFKIGHSYFCKLDELDKNRSIDEEVKLILRYDIMPMLKEYWYDDENKVKEWKKELLGE